MSLQICRKNKLLTICYVEDHEINIYDLENLKPQANTPICTIRCQHPAWYVDFSHSNTKIVVGQSNGYFQIYDVSNILLPQSSLSIKAHYDTIRCCVFSQKDDLVLTSSWDKALKSWSSLNGEQIHTFKGHTTPVWSCALSADDAFVASTSEAGIMKIWDFATSQCLISLKAHDSQISYVAFSPTNPQTLLTASDDRTLKIWHHQPHRKAILFMFLSARLARNSPLSRGKLPLSLFQRIMILAGLLD